MADRCYTIKGETGVYTVRSKFDFILSKRMARNSNKSSNSQRPDTSNDVRFNRSKPKRSKKTKPIKNKRVKMSNHPEPIKSPVEEESDDIIPDAIYTQSVPSVSSADSLDLVLPETPQSCVATPPAKRCPSHHGTNTRSSTSGHRIISSIIRSKSGKNLDSSVDNEMENECQEGSSDDEDDTQDKSKVRVCLMDKFDDVEIHDDDFETHNDDDVEVHDDQMMKGDVIQDERQVEIVLERLKDCVMEGLSVKDNVSNVVSNDILLTNETQDFNPVLEASNYHMQLRDNLQSMEKVPHLVLTKIDTINKENNVNKSTPVKSKRKTMESCDTSRKRFNETTSNSNVLTCCETVKSKEHSPVFVMLDRMDCNITPKQSRVSKSTFKSSSSTPLKPSSSSPALIYAVKSSPHKQAETPVRRSRRHSTSNNDVIIESEDKSSILSSAKKRGRPRRSVFNSDMVPIIDEDILNQDVNDISLLTPSKRNLRPRPPPAVKSTRKSPRSSS